MAWFKVDDGFWSHPKTLRLTTDAIALWVRAGTWSCQQLTDGFVPDYALGMFGIDTAAVALLVEVGYWTRDDEQGGYLFHDWSEYQEESDKVKARRQAARDRMKAVRENKTRTKGERSREQEANVRDQFEGSSLNPDPTRPDPTRPTSSNEEVPGGSATPPPMFCRKHPNGTEDACRPCGDARRTYEAWRPPLKLTPTPPRKEDYCERHDWLLKKGCAECADERRASA